MRSPALVAARCSTSSGPSTSRCLCSWCCTSSSPKSASPASAARGARARERARDAQAHGAVVPRATTCSSSIPSCTRRRGALHGAGALGVNAAPFWVRLSGCCRRARADRRPGRGAPGARSAAHEQCAPRGRRARAAVAGAIALLAFLFRGAHAARRPPTALPVAFGLVLVGFAVAAGRRSAICWPASCQGRPRLPGRRPPAHRRGRGPRRAHGLSRPGRRDDARRRSHPA